MSRGPDGHRAGGGETRRDWNERHASATFSDVPVDWLLEQRALLESQRRGRALDIACGGGRNTTDVGLLLFETLVGPRPESRGSFGLRCGLKPDELRRAFASLTLLHYDEVQIGSDASGYRTVARQAAGAPGHSETGTTIGQ